MARREELLRDEAEHWAAFEAALDAVPADRVERPGVNAEGWAVRDMMWHVAFWCSEAGRALADIAEGRPERASVSFGESRPASHRASTRPARIVAKEPIQSAAICAPPSPPSTRIG